MWGIEKLDKRIYLLENELRKEINELKETHKVCASCGITGHKADMVEDYSEYPKDFYGNLWYSTGTNIYPKYYHNGCYAEKFNKHLCPCKCGKWIDNKKKDCKKSPQK